MLAKHFGDGEHNVCRSRTDRNRSGQLETNNFWNQHRHRLTKHCCLGLDAADTPSEHTETVHHGRVRVCSDTAVRIGLKLATYIACHYGSRQVFDVHLVHDAGARRNNLEIIKSRLTPTQELVTLCVASIFKFNVSFEGICRPCNIDNYRVIDDHFSWCKRINFLWVSAEIGNGFTHCG